MFLVMSPHVQTNPMNSNDTIDANTSQDSARGDMKKDSSAPPTILFLHGNAGNIGHRYGNNNYLYYFHLNTSINSKLRLNLRYSMLELFVLDYLM